MDTSEVIFTKLTAGGNDFICIDNTSGHFDGFLESSRLRPWISALCRRGLGVGADGVIFAGERGGGGGVDICARFLEPDGSEAELCGNGTACFTWWCLEKGLVHGPEVRILTAAGTAIGKAVEGRPGRVLVCVPDPRDLRLGLRLEVKCETWEVDYVVTGVPHAVAYVEDLAQLDVAHWGPGIRHHPRFAPRGVNANFVQVLDVGLLAIRTFEFGVEAETLACGTGSAAAAITTCLRYEWPEPFRRGDRPVRVQVRGGETLFIWFVCTDGKRVTDVCLETRAQAVYEGRILPEFHREVDRCRGPETVVGTT
ncbi:MAG: diaminopimelate epimerase [Kiritimatiellaeota bacterium]|nr:diaminopimelate epimerase [Kiritimatiellota bacterium]